MRDGWMPDEHGDPATVALVVPDTLLEFTTPARDDAFTFTVRVRVVWKATVTDSDPERREEMQREIDRFLARRRETIRSDVMSRIRTFSRTLPPYRADELERMINEEHARLHLVMHKCPDPPAHGPAARPSRDRAVVDAPYDLVDAQLYAWVDLCDEIRAVRQREWLARTEQAGEHARTVQHIEQLADLQERWRELLLGAMRRMGHVDEDNAAWITAEALRLAAGDRRAPAEVLAEAIERRTEEGRRLTDHLAELINTADRGEAGLFEFTFASDTALREVLRHLGVPVPEIDRARRDGKLPD